MAQGTAVALNPDSKMVSSHTKLNEGLTFTVITNCDGEHIENPYTNDHEMARQELQFLMDRYEFNKLYDQWYLETMFQSSPFIIMENENFAKIVQMGEGVVPFILEKLNEEPNLIVWALYPILGLKDNTVMDIEELCSYWVAIGKSLQLI